MIYRRSILETLPHDTRQRRDQSVYKKICLSCNVRTDALSNERILLPSMIPVKFPQPLWRCMVVHTGLTIFYGSNAQVLQVSARVPATLTEFYDFPQYPYANFWTVTSGRPSFHFFLWSTYHTLSSSHLILHRTHRWQHRRYAPRG
jgi:hypothetical protein